MEKVEFTWNKVYMEVRRNYYENLTGSNLEIPSILGFLHKTRRFNSILGNVEPNAAKRKKGNYEQRLTYM